MDWLLTILGAAAAITALGMIAHAVQSVTLELKLQRHAIEELIGVIRESRK